MSYRERILGLFLHKARLRQLKNKVIQYYARVFQREKKRERKEDEGKKKELVGLFPNKQPLAHSLSKHHCDGCGRPEQSLPPGPQSRYVLDLTLPRII